MAVLKSFQLFLIKFLELIKAAKFKNYFTKIKIPRIQFKT